MDKFYEIEWDLLLNVYFFIHFRFFVVFFSFCQNNNNSPLEIIHVSFHCRVAVVVNVLGIPKLFSIFSYLIFFFFSIIFRWFSSFIRFLRHFVKHFTSIFCWKEQQGNVQALFVSMKIEIYKQGKYFNSIFFLHLTAMNLIILYLVRVIIYT